MGGTGGAREEEERVEREERLEREEETRLGRLEDLTEERDTNAEGRCRDDDIFLCSVLESGLGAEAGGSPKRRVRVLNCVRAFVRPTCRLCGWQWKWPRIL